MSNYITGMIVAIILITIYSVVFDNTTIQPLLNLADSMSTFNK